MNPQPSDYKSDALPIAPSRQGPTRIPLPAGPVGLVDTLKPVAPPPLLTVAVAMFNSADTIERALRSVYDQDCTNVEVVVVDDGSTDESLAVAQGVWHEGIMVRFVSHDTNRGLGPARNTAVSNALGDYIVFVDSDDEMLPGSLRAIAETARKSPADVLLVGTLEHKRGRDRPLHSPELLTAVASSTTPWTVFDHPELVMWPPSTWSRVLRRQFVIDADIEFPPGFHQDGPSSTEAFLRAESVSAVDHLCYRYIRGGEGSSATRSKGTKTLVRIAQMRRIRERNDLFGLPERLKQYLVAMVAVHLVWGNRAAYRTMPEELHEQFFHDSSTELQWWFHLAQPNKTILSEPLMPTAERELFTVALLGGSYRLWQEALKTHSRKLRWQRRFDLSRYRLFKS